MPVILWYISGRDATPEPFIETNNDRPRPLVLRLTTPWGRLFMRCERDFAMSTELQSPDTEKLARKINRHHRKAEGYAAKALEHALKCGEFLIEAKWSVGHGSWLDWLHENFEGSPRNARKYMSLYRHQSFLERSGYSTANLSISSAISLIQSGNNQSRDESDKEDSGAEFEPQETSIRHIASARPVSESVASQIRSAIDLIETGRRSLDMDAIAQGQQMLEELHQRLATNEPEERN